MNRPTGEPAAAGRPEASPAETGASAAGAPRTPVALGVLDDVLGFHVARARVTTNAIFDRQVGIPLGLKRVEYSLLLLLSANGQLSASRIGRALALTPPHVTLLLDRLQQRGLLTRARSDADRRRREVRLTEDGQQWAGRAAMAAALMEADLADRLSHAERLMLIELLRKLA